MKFLSRMAFLWVLISVALVAIVSGATIHVPADFSTIQAAVNAANSGDTINVADGTYAEVLNLQNKTLDIEGAGSSLTIIDAHSFTGYAIQNFGDNSAVKNLKLIGTGSASSSYGFKISETDGIILKNIVVENSYKTGVDLNTVSNAMLKNIEVRNTVYGFGLMILNSHRVLVDSIATSGNVWGGVSVQTSSSDGTDSVMFSGNFDVTENLPLLLEQDPYMGGLYSDITNVQIPSKFHYIVYDFRYPENYKQWYYFETVDGAKAFAQGIAGSPLYANVTAYDIAEANYYVAPGMKIQDAVNAAGSDDVINIDAGTYNTTGQVLIDKSLVFVGATGKPIIQPDTDLPQTNNVGGAWFLVNPDVTFSLNNFVLDGNGRKVHQAVRSHGTTTINSVDFLNIRNSGSPYVGFAIASFGGTVSGGAGSDTHGSGGDSSMLTVSNSTFTQIGRIGILVKGTGSTANINGNTYNGKADGDFLDYAFEAGAGGSATISNNVISNCRGVAASDGSTSAGILATTYYGAGTKVTITGNQITNSYDGVAVGYNSSDSSIVVAHNNYLTTNTFGIESTNPVVDATNNWWGSPTGPTTARNAGGLGDIVSDSVDFAPWYIDSQLKNLVVDQALVITQDPTSIGPTGTQLTISIMSIPDSANYLVIYQSGTPTDTPVTSGETFPSGVTRRTAFIWGIVEIGSDTADITLDYSGLPGVYNPSTLYVIKRESVDSPWVDVTSQFVNDIVNHKFTATGISSFSEFSIGSSEDNPLPVETETNVPKVFALEQNYPNPFNPMTTIEFTLPKDGFVTLKIFNVVGQEIATLVNGVQRAGTTHRITFNASALPSGIYFARLSFDVDGRHQQLIRKMALLK